METKVSKSSIKIEHLEWTEIKFLKQDVLINPYISLAEENLLLDNYLRSLFKDGDYKDNYIEAEYGLILQILDAQSTSIELFKDDVMLASFEDVIGSGLWDMVVPAIRNYKEFRSHVATVVEATQRQKDLEKSIGGTVDKLANKLMEFLNKISDLDLSEPGIQKLLEEFKKASGDYKDKFMPDVVQKPVGRKKPVKKALVQ